MHEGKWAARTLWLLGRRGKKETCERKEASLLPLHPRNQSKLFTVILRITYSPTIFLEWIWLWTYKIVNILGSKQGQVFGWVLDLVQGFNQWSGDYAWWWLFPVAIMFCEWHWKRISNYNGFKYDDSPSLLSTHGLREIFMTGLKPQKSPIFSFLWTQPLRCIPGFRRGLV